jgi:hypothetical protein
MKKKKKVGKLENKIYKCLPGSLALKKTLMVVIIILLFGYSFSFFVLSAKEVDDNFSQRVANTRLK